MLGVFDDEVDDYNYYDSKVYAEGKKHKNINYIIYIYNNNVYEVGGVTSTSKWLLFVST